MTTSRRTVPLEHEVQSEIIRWLAEKKIFHYRNNSGAALAEYTNKAGVTSKRYMQFGISGAPDIVAIVKGIYVGIEVKRETTKQTEAQAVFERRVTRAGGIYILARKLEEVEKIINPLI